MPDSPEDKAPQPCAGDIEARLASLQQRLDECQAFPCDYTFKFIVPAQSALAMQEFLAGFDVSTRQSSSGTYVSFTATLPMDTSSAIISVYRGALGIPGCIAL